MARYVQNLADSGTIAAGSACFTAMKYHEAHGVTMGRVASYLSGKHCVVQCEQGVDIFVEPLTSEWLQDNYEDNAMHNACITWAEQAHAPALLVQTNADLDLSRGIDGDELSRNVFEGRLQTNAFEVPITWPGLAGQALESAPKTIIGIALELSMATPKRAAFQQLLNFDPVNFSTLPRLYAAYIAFSASISDAQVPIAGVLEVISALQHSGHSLPWRMEDASAPQPPAPQWVVARFVLPGEGGCGVLRVISQLREANMHCAESAAVYLGRWMFARRDRRQRRYCIPRDSRHVPGFWAQLTAAVPRAREVRRRCPNFELWRGDSWDFLVTALLRMAEAMKIAGLNERKTYPDQPDYGEREPLFILTGGGVIHIFDFLCRLLEAPGGIDAEREAIESGLPPCPPEDQLRTNTQAADMLMEALIGQWLESAFAAPMAV